MKFDIWREVIPSLFEREGSVDAQDLEAAQGFFLQRKTEVKIREKDIFLIIPQSPGKGGEQGSRFRVGKTKPRLIAEVVNNV